MSAPVTFVRDGREFICCYHEGWQREHPANAGASHGACDACLVKMAVTLEQPREEKQR